MEPRAVVVPFAVPEGGRGLGLAALLHAHVQVFGGSVALVQLQSRRSGTADGLPGEPEEAIVTPQAWRDLTAAREAPASVRAILTGSLEPPGDESGFVRLLAFDARTSAPLGAAEGALDDDTAGAGLLRVLGSFSAPLEADLGALAELSSLSWEALESVLRAERAVLLGRTREGSRRSALLYLGRALADAPEASFPALRLGALALEAAGAGDEALLATAQRALASALEDAPHQVPLLEAAAVLAARRDQREDAMRFATAAKTHAPARPQAYAVVAELARRRGDREAARQELLRGLEQAGPDAGLEVELAALHKETGDAAGARRLLQQVLARHPHHGDAFSHLAALALLERDVDLASDLVDRALALEPPSLAVLRPAMELALQAEPEGLPRAARLRALCRRVLAQAPDDGWASVLEGAALAQAGERDQALAILVAVTTRFPDSPFAAEAARGILVIEEPDIATELESLLKEGEGASPERARLLAERARRLAPKKPVWVHPFTVGALERRAGRTAEARAALAEATALAPAAPPVHRELGLLDAESNRPPPPSAPTPLWKALARLLRAR